MSRGLIFIFSKWLFKLWLKSQHYSKIDVQTGNNWRFEGHLNSILDTTGNKLPVNLLKALSCKGLMVVIEANFVASCTHFMKLIYINIFT